MRLIHISIISFVVFLQSVAKIQSLGISTESTTTLKSPVVVSPDLDKRARLDSNSELQEEKRYRCGKDYYTKTVVHRTVEKLCNLLIKEQKGVGRFGLPKTSKKSRQTTAPSQLFPKEDVTKLYQIQIGKPSFARRIFYIANSEPAKDYVIINRLCLFKAVVRNEGERYWFMCKFE
ncbi:hypothetical protein GcC1_028036 [Golovinomyces cichoracearum]|uniref:Secreted effector protein n=1 Tax=Golovinomyces cichoracearum TaxID=62708 RepID=A0A420J368_9PEZI|nr:hypothetical protein GcC1_028036 [Golovinomyces cichoracearum]